MKNNQYNPQKCKNGGCPCYAECGKESLYEEFAKKIRKISKNEQWVSLEEAEESLQKVFDNAVQSKDKKIHLIRAQTAIGKTHLYCQYAKQHPEIPFLFVVPTIKLQEEVYSKLKSMGGMFICRSAVLQ